MATDRAFCLGPHIRRTFRTPLLLVVRSVTGIRLVTTFLEARGAGSLTPKIPEPIRRQLGIPHRVLNVAMPEPSLQRPRVVSGIR